MLNVKDLLGNKPSKESLKDAKEEMNKEEDKVVENHDAWTKGEIAEILKKTEEVVVSESPGATKVWKGIAPDHMFAGTNTSQLSIEDREQFKETLFQLSEPPFREISKLNPDTDKMEVTREYPPTYKPEYNEERLILHMFCDMQHWDKRVCELVARSAKLRKELFDYGIAEMYLKYRQIMGVPYDANK